MKPRILCSCVTFPSWARVVVQGKLTADGYNNKDRLKTTCPVPECGKEFAFEGDPLSMVLQVAVVPDVRLGRKVNLLRTKSHL